VKFTEKYFNRGAQVISLLEFFGKLLCQRRKAQKSPTHRVDPYYVISIGSTYNIGIEEPIGVL